MTEEKEMQMPKKAQENNTATLGFEAKLWHAADLMRGEIDMEKVGGVMWGLCGHFIFDTIHTP